MLADSHVSRLPGSRSAAYARCLGAVDPLIDVSIIIVNRNTKELLRACLRSIEQSTSCNIEVIVVDNASHDGSLDMVADEFPHVQRLSNDRNMGFSAANNRGLTMAHGRHLLLLNSDTIMLNGAVDAMVAYMDQHTDVGALGPHLLNPDRSDQLSVYPFPMTLQDCLVILEINRWPIVGHIARGYGQRRDTHMSAQTGPIDWVMGACLLLRREAIEQVGVLDDRFFFGVEETELCYRLRQCGWATHYFTGAEVVHLGGQSWSQMSAAYLLWSSKGRLRYYYLHKTSRAFLAFRVALAVSSMGHILSLVWAMRSSPRARALMSAYARVLTYCWRGRKVVEGANGWTLSILSGCGGETITQ